jgi:hypothetical protein
MSSPFPPRNILQAPPCPVAGSITQYKNRPVTALPLIRPPKPLVRSCHCLSSKAIIAPGPPPLSSTVTVFFSPPPLPPYLIPCCHPFFSAAVVLASALVCHRLSSAAAITTSPLLPCITRLPADAAKPLPLICCQHCHHVTSCPQPSSLLVCCHCPLLWMIVKLSASHRHQTIPFCLPPKLSLRCLSPAAAVSYLLSAAIALSYG